MSNIDKTCIRNLSILDIQTLVNDFFRFDFEYPEEHLFRKVASELFNEKIENIDVSYYSFIMPLLCEELLHRYKAICNK